MSNAASFLTVTMARIYEDQGHWNKAAEIYRYLLNQEPDRKELAQALAEAEKRVAEAPAATPEDLIPLFRQWINLLFHYNRLQKLWQIKRKL